jgi:hypothetical protein
MKKAKRWMLSKLNEDIVELIAENCCAMRRKRNSKKPQESEDVSSDLTFVSHLLKESEEYHESEVGESSLKEDNVKKQKSLEDKVRIVFFLYFISFVEENFQQIKGLFKNCTSIKKM